MDGQDVSVELFGQKYDNPLIMAPVGVQGIFHEDKETGLAAVCEEVGVPYIMSTAATSSVEEVARVTVGPLWVWPAGPMAVTPLEVPQSPAAADTRPLPSTWRHLAAPVPVEEMTRVEVVAFPEIATLPENVLVEFVPKTFTNP